MSNNKIYFRGLDGLRGIAALAVVLGHVELLKSVFKLENVYSGGGPFYLYLGGYAVTFFFVLSGFLITFLLLKEREVSGTIAVKNFYIRRILRIWPVYYILFIVGFLILPNVVFSGLVIPKAVESENYWNSFFFNLILLPNFSKVSNPIAFQSWSIGVEEQFYIFWPFLVSKIKSLKKLLYTMFGIIVLIYFLRSGVVFANYFNFSSDFLKSINQFFGESRFDNMALGGVLAILFYKNPDFRLSKIHKVLISFILILVLYKQTNFGFGLDNIFVALVFSVTIFWVVSEKRFRVLDNSLFLFLGKISYGIYMFHVIGILLALNILLYLYPNYSGDNLYLNFVLYILSILFTVLLSYGSFQFVEKPILKYKYKFN